MNISILLMHSGCLGNTINTFPISEHCSFYFWTTQRRVNKDVLMSSSFIQLLKISRDQLGKQPMQKEYIVRDWSLITGRGGLQNGKIAGPKLFAPPPSR